MVNVLLRGLVTALIIMAGALLLALYYSTTNLTDFVGHAPHEGQTQIGSRVCIPISTCSGTPDGEYKHCVSKNRRGNFISKSRAKKNGNVRDVVSTGTFGKTNCHHLNFNMDGHQAVTDYTDGSPTKVSGTSDHKLDGRSATREATEVEAFGHHHDKAHHESVPAGEQAPVVMGSAVYIGESKSIMGWIRGDTYGAAGCDRENDGNDVAVKVKLFNGDVLRKRDTNGPGDNGCGYIEFQASNEPAYHQLLEYRGDSNEVVRRSAISCHNPASSYC